MEMVTETGAMEILQIMDNEGSTIDCLRVADFSYEGADYAVLQVVEAAEPTVMMFKVTESDDEFVLTSMTPGEEFDKVVAAFKLLMEDSTSNQ